MQLIQREKQSQTARKRPMWAFAPLLEVLIQEHKVLNWKKIRSFFRSVGVDCLFHIRENGLLDNTMTSFNCYGKGSHFNAGELVMLKLQTCKIVPNAES